MVDVVLADEQIDLTPLCVAIEIEVRRPSVVAPALQNFHDDEVFEKSLGVVSASERCRTRGSAKPGGKAGVREVELGLFDERLPDVFAEGGKKVHDARRHRDVEPVAGGFPGDARFRLHFADDEFPADAAGKYRKKLREFRKSANARGEDVPVEEDL